MQIFEQKYTTKNDISLYSTKYNVSKIAFLFATLTLMATESRKWRCENGYAALTNSG